MEAPASHGGSAGSRRPGTDGSIPGARVEHLVAKNALLASAPDISFTTHHFDGYPAVLVRLERIALDELREPIVEAWLTRAPRRVAREYLAAHLSPTDSP